MRIAIPLIVFVACLLGIVFINLSSHHTESEIVGRLNDRVVDVFAQLNESLASKESVSEQVVFISYDSTGVPVDWSDNAYIPDMVSVLSSSNPYLLHNQFGDFLYLYETTSSGVDMAFYVLKRNYPLSSKYDRTAYNRDIIPKGLSISYLGDEPVTYQGQRLFTVSSSKELNTLQVRWQRYLYLIGILTVLWVLYQKAEGLLSKYGLRVGAWFLLVGLAVFRVLHWLARWQGWLDSFSLFDGDLFQFQFFYPSLGDGLLNIVCLVVFLIFVLFKMDEFTPRTRWYKFLFVVMACWGTYMVLYSLVDTIYQLGVNSDLSLDISQSLDFDISRVAVMTLIGALAILYFLIHNLAFRLCKLIWVNDRLILVLHGVALVLALVLIAFTNKGIMVLLINAGYLLVTFRFKMPDTLSSLKFQSINYLLATGVLLALVSSLAIYKSDEHKELYKMQRFISYLQVDRDIEGEFILSDIINQVGKDSVFVGYYEDRYRAENLAENRLEKYYLGTYFSNYEVSVQLYDSLGNHYLKALSTDFSSLKAHYDRSDLKTAYNNVFYDGKITDNKRKRYVCFVNLMNGQGSMMIEMIKKKFSSKHVLPQLLANRKTLEKSSYSYAYWLNGDFNFTSGSYQYRSDFDMDWLNNKNIFSVGVEKKGYRHLAAEFGGKTTLVSKKIYPTIHIVSNFSFYFILLFLLIGLVSIIKVRSERSEGIYLTFSSKIMLYSAISFIVPLVLVAGAVLSTTDRTNRKEIDKSNLKKTLRLTENLDNTLIQYQKGELDELWLEGQINDLSAYSGMDINLYDEHGVLLASSTPDIFNKGILSKYLNPVVMSKLIDRGKETAMLNESVSNFQYKTSYVRINSPGTGELLGVLAAPYFGIKNYVKRQQLQVFENIINIFTLVFILSIVLAYWVIARLTKPIVDVADRLHDTGFVNANQPIEWESDDEIGVLVKEYNNMVGKLEQSKVELARNEKEAAWREMAKQVAHEIKNPLTPMKLSIQHLTRVLADQPKRQKMLNTLLAQVDTLDEIVTSFSHFAKMPIPENEPFDMGQVLQRSVELHVDKKIDLQMPEESCVVSGDKKLFGRIFNNLILNGFQAMKEVERPMMMVSMFIEEESVLLQFQDEGIGIPEENRDKVFIPNFTTKDTGSGIGLAVAKRGIEHAGGQIWFESEVGHTTFMIRMPRLKD